MTLEQRIARIDGPIERGVESVARFGTDRDDHFRRAVRLFRCGLLLGPVLGNLIFPVPALWSGGGFADAAKNAKK
jgi:hypothetical protein